MQDRAERAENRAARLAEARREFREDGGPLRFRLAIYRARLLGLGLIGPELDREVDAMWPADNVVWFRRPA